VVNYPRGNDFAMIKIFDQNIFSQNFIVDDYPRGNEFAMIKKNSTKNLFSKFLSG
jgi:hypothetical protein